MPEIRSSSTTRDAFIEGASRAFFVLAYADFVEDEENSHFELSRPGPGEDWFDYAPESPPEAYALAGELWARLELANDRSVYALIDAAAIADKVDEYSAEDLEKFGHYMAMQAMGHGVSWFDDHAKFPIEIPHFECGMCAFDPAAYGAGCDEDDSDVEGSADDAS
jgi:hypothetical protein